ncbi:hypothetical protein, partial [Wukongibacter baidiensis]
MKIKRLLGPLIVLVLVSVFFYHTVLADGDTIYDVTIDSFTSGDLGSAVTAAYGTPEDITSLTITDGIVNATDFEWIKSELTNLETLEISGNAKVDSGTDSLMDDNTVPDG